MDSPNRRIMWHGMFLFLLGLLTGFVEQRFANIRMGLAAHLEGVMNGIFLLALGTAWTEVRLAPPAKAIAYWPHSAALMGIGSLPLLRRSLALQRFLRSQQQAIVDRAGRRV